MTKLWKFGLGLVLGAVTGAALYRTYQNAEDKIRVELVDWVREHFKDQEIDVVWLFDEPIHEHIFAGGLNLANGSSINFEINEVTLEITQEVA